MSLRRWWVLGLGLLLGVAPARALEPGNVFLLVNKNVRESRPIAEHYCKKRGVPEKNILALDLPPGEDITREDYNRRIVAPLRAALKDRKEEARVLVSVYGVPLRVGPHLPNAEERAQLAALQPKLDKVQAEEQQLRGLVASLEAEGKEEPPGEMARSLRERRQELAAVQARLRPLRERRRILAYEESHACVDSELSLLWWDGYDLRRWQVNVLNWQVPEAERRRHPPVVMVSRLDGPTPAVARALVDRALEGERTGLAGKVYVDARGIVYDPKRDPGFGYGGYDESLREMARLLEREAKLPVVLDNKPALFAPGSCPDCALYCGWYSLANYVDCCRFVPGAVAYHIASSEAVSLRNPGARYWCKCLLEKGVAATLGPVAEPYTIGFPKPEEFFGFLVTGRYTLVECYYRTALLNSWMTVLVGDPLYNPYGRGSRLSPEQVWRSPRGGQPLWRPNKDKRP
jgi:uncharacterized protein (TIGR03790 family)